MWRDKEWRNVNFREKNRANESEERRDRDEDVYLVKHSRRVRRRNIEVKFFENEDSDIVSFHYVCMRLLRFRRLFYLSTSNDRIFMILQ